jgi:hypothetical protein
MDGDFVAGIRSGEFEDDRRGVDGPGTGSSTLGPGEDRAGLSNGVEELLDGSEVRRRDA